MSAVISSGAETLSDREPDAFGAGEALGRCTTYSCSSSSTHTHTSIHFLIGMTLDKGGVEAEKEKPPFCNSAEMQRGWAEV